MRNQGFAIPLTLFIIVVLIGLGTSLFIVSRQELHQAIAYGNREMAYFLARSDSHRAIRQVNKFLDFLNDSDPDTFPKKNKAPADLRIFTDNFLRSDGSLIKTGKKFVLNQNTPAWIDALVEPDLRIGTMGLSVKTEISLSPGLNLNISPASGIRADDKEFSLVLRVDSAVTISGRTVTLTKFKECRHVNMLPAILGKFTLYAANINGSLNTIDDSVQSASLTQMPFQIFNGTKTDYRSLSPEAARDFFDNQGWIFIGGESRSFNMSQCGSREDCMDPFLNTGIALYEMEAGSYLKNYGLSYYSTQKGNHKELNESYYHEALLNKIPSSHLVSSRINLFGSQNRFSPTMVIGAITRNWALIQGLTSTGTKLAPLPYLSEDEYLNASDWPGSVTTGTVALIRLHFGQNSDGYQKYMSRMSNIVEEAYNRGNLQAVDFGTANLSRVLPDPDTLSSAKPPPSQRLRIAGTEKRFYENLSGYDFSVLNTDGNLLYQGDLGLQEYNSFLNPRICLKGFTEESFFRQYYKSLTNTLYLGGIVEINGDLLLDRPLNIAAGGGGIVVVNGNVRIRETILCATGEVFSIIVRSGGTLSVETGQPIEAGLINLEGKIKLGRDFEIKGIIAANALEVLQATTANRQSLNYQPLFDITNAENYKKYYKMVSSPFWSSYVN